MSTTSETENTNDSWNYTPLPEPIPITEQVWPEGTRPLVCTRTMTYNHENYIRECIEGILMQKTTFPVRVCIHDDASTDKTAEIVREYQEKYPNLIWAYYQEENTFRQPKRDELRSEFFGWVKAAKYQAPCEGDDYWIYDLKLEEQARILEANSNISLVQGRAKKVYKGEIIGEMTGGVRTWMYRNSIQIPSIYRNNIPYGDMLSKTYFKIMGKIYGINRNIGVWRIHSDGMYGPYEHSGITDMQLYLKIKSYYWIGKTLSSDGKSHLAKESYTNSIILILNEGRIGLLELLLGIAKNKLKKIISRIKTYVK